MKNHTLRQAMPHPASKCKMNCGIINCPNKAVGVFEVKDGDSICDAPLCESCAINENASKL